MTAPNEALIEAMVNAIQFGGDEYASHATWESNTRAALAIAAPILEARFLDRLIAKADEEGIVFVSDGHFGRAKRIQDWLRAQAPVEGGE